VHQGAPFYESPPFVKAPFHPLCFGRVLSQSSIRASPAG
jgi:hypothetical protein